VAADRVDVFIANSETTQQRIAKYYAHDAKVIYPPVSADRFKLSDQIGNYYLIVGRQTAYKRTDLAIAAFNYLKLPLKVIGTGPALKKWMLKARKNIEFLGRLSDAEVANYLSHCQALVMPQEEDAGIVPLEAMASGRPVIAYRGGGAMETIVEGKTGMFFDQQTPQSLIEAVKEFAQKQWEPEVILRQAQKFDLPVFQKKIFDFVQAAYTEHVRLMERK
jgi:glycosyltransferase involved in cell wall biosynthesis